MSIKIRRCILPTFIVLFVSFLLPACYGTAEDHARVNSYRDALEASYPFKFQREDGTGVAVYCSAISGRNSISVYGDYDAEEISAIEKVAQRLQVSRDETVKTEIRFYKEEMKSDTHYHTIVVK